MNVSQWLKFMFFLRHNGYRIVLGQVYFYDKLSSTLRFKYNLSIIYAVLARKTSKFLI